MYGAEPSLPPSLVPATYNLEVHLGDAHLELYNNEGKLVLDITYSGYAQSSLVGTYNGIWAFA